MKNYKHFILNVLLDRYERSSLYKGQNKVKVSIFLKFTPETTPDYYDEYNFETRQEINEQCIYLENKGLLHVCWKKYEQGNIIDRVTLNTERLEDVYREIQREKKQTLENNTMSILKSFPNQNGWFAVFIENMVDLLNQKKSIKKYLDVEDPELTNNILLALEKILKQESEIPKRMFSIQLFKNSKLFEKIENKVIRIIKDFGDVNEDIDVLAEYNIVSNPGFVYLKGNGIFQCNHEVIDLEKLKGEIGLSTSIIKNLEPKQLKLRRIITIENLTTFYSFEPKDELVVYLGGYHNSIRRDLLQKIYSVNKVTPFYHWGDIDLGGFRIFNHLRKMTKIPFQPYMMDIDTLKEYKEYAGKIDSKVYIESLRKLLEDKDYYMFHEVISYMLKFKIKLEQEALDIKEIYYPRVISTSKEFII